LFVVSFLGTYPGGEIKKKKKKGEEGGGLWPAVFLLSVLYADAVIFKGEKEGTEKKKREKNVHWWAADFSADETRGKKKKRGREKK